MGALRKNDVHVGPFGNGLLRVRAEREALVGERAVREDRHRPPGDDNLNARIRKLPLEPAGARQAAVMGDVNRDAGRHRNLDQIERTVEGIGLPGLHPVGAAKLGRQAGKGDVAVDVDIPAVRGARLTPAVSSRVR